MTFDNRRFWNNRYVNDPKMGSGPGSRNENLVLKNTLIRSVISEHRIESILDIGCGDIAVLDGLELNSYLGIDISEAVVERNSAMRPHWQFRCEDLAGRFVPPPADLVLCLDVLIHQRSRKDYANILTKALRSARKVGLVSGYSRPDPGWNVFFHEPIATTVRQICPNAVVEKVSEYRGTDLLKVSQAVAHVAGAAS